MLEISTKPGFHKEKTYVLKDVLMPYTPEIIFLPNHSVACLPLHLPSQPTSHLPVQPSICLFVPHPSIHLSIKSIIRTSVYLSRHPPPLNLHQAMPLAYCLFSGETSMQNHKWVVRADAGSLQRLPMETQQRTIKFVFSSSVLENGPCSSPLPYSYKDHKPFN